VRPVSASGMRPGRFFLPPIPLPRRGREWDEGGDVAFRVSRQKLTPYPLPTKDEGVLRTIGDARAYMVALSKNRERRAHSQQAWRLLLQGAAPAALTRQVHLALFMDGKLDAGAFEHMSSARRWRRHALTS
jgi:hypothetical protein